MKKIALLMDSWKRFFTYAWPAGILERIRETREMVNLYIFNSSGGWSKDTDYNMGEYNIYRLPNLSEFDGIILDVNNVSYDSVREYVIQAAKASGRPVVSVNNEIEDFYYVGIDNYKAIREIIAHLYEKHGCRSFWFVMGPKENYENSVRAQAIKDYLKEHALAWREEDFFYKNYEYSCGYQGFEQLLKSHGQIPDAVVCANDNIAVGVCEAAKKQGYRIPGDFLVSGFDNFDKAAYYSPQITTVSHIREEVGYKSADLLLRIWAGETVQRFNYTDAKTIFWESCGCEPNTALNWQEHARDHIIYGIETDEFEEQVLSLEYELMKCRNVQDMIRCIPQCIPSMKCDAMYLIADEHIHDFRDKVDLLSQTSIQDEGFRIHGYPDTMNVEFAYENGDVRDTGETKVQSLFPMFEHEEGGTDFLFMPIHFRDRTIGYFVIRNAVYMMEKQYLFSILNTITEAMENLHEKEKLEYMNNALSELYVRDAMTGMYNRMGYEKLACRLFEKKKAERENLLIQFVDMDRLKYINDHFGHEHGDTAIKIIAKAIMKHCSKNAVPVRTGGDEFLIIQECISPREAEKIIAEIRVEIYQEAERLQLPYQLSISAGSVYTDMTSDKTLDNYVKEADEIMYTEKVAKKANRTS